MESSRKEPLTPLQRLWFTFLVAAQVTMAVVMPAFNGPDERGHFIRLWALAEGHFSCRTVPAAVRDVDAMRTVGARETLRAYFDRGLHLKTNPTLVDGWDYQCAYFPIGLAAPALATRLVARTPGGQLRDAGVFVASYAARLTLMLTLDAALLLLLYAWPEGRIVALAFCSNPQLVQQSVCIGHDAFLFASTLLLLVAVLRPPSWRTVSAISLLAALMAAVKPVYAPFSLLALPHLAQLDGAKRFGVRQWLSSGVVILPALVYPVLKLIDRESRRLWTPGFSHPDLQARFLAEHPLHVFTVFRGYLHYFVDDHVLVDFYPRLINGKWTTLFGVFGNAEFEMSPYGYPFVMAMLALAVAAAALTPRVPASSPPNARFSMPARALAVFGVLAPIPLTVIALYLTFSHVGSAGPYGVQGRYHLPSLLLGLALGVWYARMRWGAPGWPAARALAWLAFVAALGANAFAISAVYSHYWH